MIKEGCGDLSLNMRGGRTIWGCALRITHGDPAREGLTRGHWAAGSGGCAPPSLPVAVFTEAREGLAWTKLAVSGPDSIPLCQIFLPQGAKATALPGPQFPHLGLVPRSALSWSPLFRPGHQALPCQAVSLRITQPRRAHRGCSVNPSGEPGRTQCVRGACWGGETGASG